MKKILPWLIAVPILILCVFLIWGLLPQDPMPEVQSYLQSNRMVTVTSNSWLTFTPTTEKPVETGFIFYPGGHVNYRSYAPAGYQIAQKGLLVVIVPMPISLAVFNPDAATEVMAAYPRIKTWIIGGHSLGGVMAANFAYKHPEKTAGLVLWAAYPAENNDLRDFHIPVLSIYGDKDGQAGKLKENSNRLPASSVIIEIKGGNHGQMGWYGDQPGDNPATIPRSEQQKQIIEATWSFIQTLMP